MRETNSLSFDDQDQKFLGRDYDQKTAGFVFLGILALMVGGIISFTIFRPKLGPPPAEIAGDPVLVAGREVFLERCASCHGVGGKGDGAIAKSLAGPPPRNLTQMPWKHGEKPEEVLKVVANGVQGTSMPGWESSLGPEKTKAAAAYVFYLAHKPVPAEYRPASDSAKK